MPLVSLSLQPCPSLSRTLVSRSVLTSVSFRGSPRAWSCSPASYILLCCYAMQSAALAFLLRLCLFPFPWMPGTLPSEDELGEEDCLLCCLSEPQIAWLLSRSCWLCWKELFIVMLFSGWLPWNFLLSHLLRLIKVLGAMIWTPSKCFTVTTQFRNSGNLKPAEMWPLFLCGVHASVLHSLFEYFISFLFFLSISITPSFLKKKHFEIPEVGDTVVLCKRSLQI